MVTAAIKLKDTCSLEESYDKLRQCIKKPRHHFANKGLYSQSYDFFSSHVSMWELDHKKAENWRTDASQYVYIYILLRNYLYAEYMMWNAVLYEAQAEIKISRRNIYHLR